MTEVYDRKYQLIVGSPQHTYDIIQEGLRLEGEEGPTSVAGYIFPRVRASSVLTEDTDENLTNTSFADSGVSQRLLGYKDFLTIPAGARGFSYTDLQLEATIEYGSTNSNSGGNEQDMEIKLYNPSPDTQKFIRAEGVVFLKAGYAKDVIVNEQGEEDYSKLPLLFVGQILSVKTKKEGEDAIMILTCGDNKFTRNNIRVSNSYEPGTTYEEIIADLLVKASEAGLPTGYFDRAIPDLSLRTDPEGTETIDLSPLPSSTNVTYNNSGDVVLVEGEQFNSKYLSDLVASLTRRPVLADRVITGYNIEGSLLDKLEELCLQLGYRVYVSLGKLYVEPNKGRGRFETYIIDADTVKDAIRQEEDSSGQGLSGDKKVSGIKFTVFLDGNISLEKYAKVTYGQYKGLYKIVSLKHKLSFEGNAWDTEVVADKV